MPVGSMPDFGMALFAPPQCRQSAADASDDAASVEVVALPSTFALNAVVSISRQRPFSPHLRFVG